MENSRSGAIGRAKTTPCEPVSQIDIAENLTSGVRWLRFTERVERVFEAETGARRSRHLMIGMIPALLLFEIIVLTDFQALPDIFWPAIVIRLGVMNIVGIAAMLILWRNPRPAIREGAAATVVVVQSALLMVLVAWSQSEFRGHYHVGMLLGLMFGVMVLRVRFWHMLAAAFITCAFFFITSIVYSGLPQIEQQGMASVMVAATVFSMIAGYSLEREQRLTWLRSLNERLRSDRFEEMSHVDPLTGLGNRRALDLALAALRESGQTALGVAIAIADIDSFKAYNDAYGHVAGDDCLRRVAGLLVSEARKHEDMVFRFGGEEFVILLHAIDESTALRTCERMRRTIEAAAIPHMALRQGKRVTMSIGVAVTRPDEEFDAEMMIFKADSELYKAKRNGRNQVSPLPIRLTAERRQAS